MEQDGLGLVVTRVAGGDRSRAEVACDTSQERIAGVARIVLVLRRRVRATRTQRGADMVGELRDERRVRSGRARTRAVIEVRDVKHEADVVAQLREEERERGRVGAAGDREDERTGTEDLVGARVGTDGAENRGRENHCHWWLGADSNRRPVGYESTALGQLSYPAACARDDHSIGVAARRSASRRARNSVSVIWPFCVLHVRHAGSTLSIAFVPPRDSGIRWSTWRGPASPRYAHLPS